MQITTQPPKGTIDLFPKDFAIRKYIFDKWREVCTSFGYEEYLSPLIEYSDIYKAKSGEDLGGRELWTLIDRGGRELAIRPEMTPSVTRMVSKIYSESIKPIRYFSIANFMRNENTQRGRSREFWQLNFDIFGSHSNLCDIEVLHIALEIMLKFQPPKGSFTMFINNRKLIDFILSKQAKVDEEKRVEVIRTLDKWEKLTSDEFQNRMIDIGISREQIDLLRKFMESRSEIDLVENIPEVKEEKGFIETINILNKLREIGYGDWIKFQPNIIRGFDYYDGMVFEIFDNNPKNNRSMFGGGRYNGLSRIFGVDAFPAVGSAPGEVTTLLFLEEWDLIKNIEDYVSKIRVYAPIVDKEGFPLIQRIASRLRLEGKIVETGVEEEKIGRALDYSNRKSFDFTLILGENEIRKGVYILKDMKRGEQKDYPL